MKEKHKIGEDKDAEIARLSRSIEELERINQRSHEDLLRMQVAFEDFAFSVSHNLRAPISDILSVFLLLEAQGFPVEIAEFLKIIQAKTETLDSLIHDLNYIVRQQRGVHDLYQRIEMDEICRSILMTYEDQIAQQNVSIKTDFEVIPGFLTSRESLQNIMSQLLDNALKFRRLSGAHMVSIRTEATADSVIISIQDNGLGIDMERFGRRLFKPYEKLNSGVTGKGLGLYLSKLQTEMLGGTLSLTSKPNIGTTVRIEFPLLIFANEHVLLDSEWVRFSYYPVQSAIHANWKKDIQLDQFDELLRVVLEFMDRYRTKTWIADIRNSFNNEEELNRVRERFKTRLQQTSMERFILIVNAADIGRVNDPRNLSKLNEFYKVPVFLTSSLEEALENCVE